MRHPVYSVRYSMVPITSSLLTITLYCSAVTTHVYSDKKISFRDVITEFDCTYRRTRINDDYEIEKLGNCIEGFVRGETTLNTEINVRGSKNEVTFFFFFTAGKAVSFPRTNLLRGMRF